MRTVVNGCFSSLGSELSDFWIIVLLISQTFGSYHVALPLCRHQSAEANAVQRFDFKFGIMQFVVLIALGNVIPQ